MPHFRCLPVGIHQVIYAGSSSIRKRHRGSGSRSCNRCGCGLGNGRSSGLWCSVGASAANAGTSAPEASTCNDSIRPCEMPTKCASLQPAGYQLRSTESVSRGRKGISQGYCPGPELGRLSNNLAASYLHAGKTTEAIAEFQKALRLDPQNHLAGLNLADYYLNRSDYARSLRYFRQAGADHSQDPAVLFGLAKAYFGARQPQSGL